MTSLLKAFFLKFLRFTRSSFRSDDAGGFSSHSPADASSLSFFVLVVRARFLSYVDDEIDAVVFEGQSEFSGSISRRLC